MNFGIIGYGYTGQQHARAIAEIEGVTLKTVVEQDEGKRLTTPVRSFSDYRLLLDDDAIDAVSICLPHAAAGSLGATATLRHHLPFALRARAGARRLSCPRHLPTPG